MTKQIERDRRIGNICLGCASASVTIGFLFLAVTNLFDAPIYSVLMFALTLIPGSILYSILRYGYPLGPKE